MAQSSLMELSTRIERAALALRDAEQVPTAAQLVVVMEDLSRTNRHLARAIERWVGWVAKAARPDSDAAADGETATEELRQLVTELNRCEGAAAGARDALLDLGRNT
jgi:hypothetical protein